MPLPLIGFYLRSLRGKRRKRRRRKMRSWRRGTPIPLWDL